MSTVFIGGAGTDVGKTFLTCALVRYFRACGHPVEARKPVISGYNPDAPETSDTYRLAQALGRTWNDATATAISPWRFAAPLSPHLAAAREGRAIDETALIAACHPLHDAHATLLIEGAGGLFSPLTPRLLNLDLAQAIHAPVLLVAGSYLGSIGHCLSTIAAAQHRGVTLLGVVVSGIGAAQAGGLEDTLSSLQQFAPSALPILPLPYAPEDATLRPEIIEIASLFHERTEA